MSSSLSKEQRYAVSRISGLVLTNALIFHEVLAQTDKRVKTLEQLLEHKNIKSELVSRPRDILHN